MTAAPPRYTPDRDYPLQDQPCRYTEAMVRQQQLPVHDQSPFKFASE